MNKKHIGIGVGVIFVAFVISLAWKPEPVVAPIPETRDTVAYVQAGEDDIVITSPLPDDVVGKTIQFTGKARGPWYFEASFPVEVRDIDGNLLGEGYGEAKGDWMTTEFVPFEGKVTYTDTDALSGFLIIKNDNPSGEPERDKSVSIPVQFAQ